MPSAAEPYVGSLRGYCGKIYPESHA
jgi:hypothetical protein